MASSTCRTSSNSVHFADEQESEYRAWEARWDEERAAHARQKEEGSARDVVGRRRRIRIHIQFLGFNSPFVADDEVDLDGKVLGSTST